MFVGNVYCTYVPGPRAHRSLDYYCVCTVVNAAENICSHLVYLEIVYEFWYCVTCIHVVCLIVHVCCKQKEVTIVLQLHKVMSTQGHVHTRSSLHKVMSTQGQVYQGQVYTKKVMQKLYISYSGDGR